MTAMISAIYVDLFSDVPCELSWREQDGKITLYLKI